MNRNILQITSSTLNPNLTLIYLHLCIEEKKKKQKRGRPKRKKTGLKTGTIQNSG